ncbi:MAG: HAD family hydrolase [Anaerolineae bacterium]
MKQINTLIFDWGGVFQRTEDYAPRQELASELGIDEPALERAVFGGSEMKDASLGKLAAIEAYQMVVTKLGYAKDVLSFVQRFFAGDRIDPRLVQLVRWERAHGLLVGLLSNAPPSLVTEHGIVGRWGMEGLFDAQVFSYQVGVLKPDKRGFEVVLHALSAIPGEAVFIDDFTENIVGAQAAGLSALLFTTLPKLLSDLDQIGVPVPDLAELGAS